MKGRKNLALTLLAAGLVPVAGSQAATAQATHAVAPAPNPVDALIDAAARGETVPLARAIADPASPADLKAVLRAALAAGRLEPAVLRDPVLRRLAAGSDPALRRAALSVLTSAAFAAGDYAEAARSGELLAQALRAAGRTEEAAGVERTWRLAALLAGHRRPGVEGAMRPGSIAAARDRVGLTRIGLSVNGQAQEAVFDTGANLSVLSAATAQRLGVRTEEGSVAVGNGVETTVATRIGIAARVEIAGNVLTNVAFLIIDDSALTFPQVPGGYAIPMIIGMPEMRALGRVRVEQAGRFTVLPPEEGVAGPANLHAGGNDLFADVSVDGRVLALHVDTGADRTALTARYAAAEPQRVAALQTGQGNFASAGGTAVRRFATWPNAPVVVAGRSFTLPALQIGLPGDGPEARFNGVLGSDVLRRFESYTLDFRAMRLSLGAPVAGHP